MPPRAECEYKPQFTADGTILIGHDGASIVRGDAYCYTLKAFQALAQNARENKLQRIMIRLPAEGLSHYLSFHLFQPPASELDGRYLIPAENDESESLPVVKFDFDQQEKRLMIVTRNGRPPLYCSIVKPQNGDFHPQITAESFQPLHQNFSFWDSKPCYISLRIGDFKPEDGNDNLPFISMFYKPGESPTMDVVFHPQGLYHLQTPISNF